MSRDSAPFPALELSAQAECGWVDWATDGRPSGGEEAEGKKKGPAQPKAKVKPPVPMRSELEVQQTVARAWKLAKAEDFTEALQMMAQAAWASAWEGPAGGAFAEAPGGVLAEGRAVVSNGVDDPAWLRILSATAAAMMVAGFSSLSATVCTRWLMSAAVGARCSWDASTERWLRIRPISSMSWSP